MHMYYTLQFINLLHQHCSLSIGTTRRVHCQQVNQYKTVLLKWLEGSDHRLRPVDQD